MQELRDEVGEGEGDVTLLGGRAGPALPFDPAASAAQMPANRVWEAPRALPFPESPSRSPTLYAQPMVNGSERPAWLGAHPDPTAGEPTGRAVPAPARPLAELQQAAREGAAAASTAALPVAAAARPAPRIRLLSDDADGQPRIEAIDVLFAPKAASAELRKASRTDCCAPERRASTSTHGSDPRATAQHAMSHAANRAADDLLTELTRALGTGDSPPIVAVGGALTLALDELSSFKATLALGVAFLRSDAGYAELLAQATRLDEVSSDLPTDTLAFMRGRLEEALRRTSKSAQLELSRDRSLIEQRRIAETDVLGGRRLRASLRSTTGPDIPCFLPQEAASSLPLSRTFASLLVAVVRTAPDAGASLVCLDVIALGRPLRERLGS